MSSFKPRSTYTYGHFVHSESHRHCQLQIPTLLSNIPIYLANLSDFLNIQCTHLASNQKNCNGVTTTPCKPGSDRKGRESLRGHRQQSSSQRRDIDSSEIQEVSIYSTRCWFVNCDYQGVVPSTHASRGPEVQYDSIDTICLDREKLMPTPAVLLRILDLIHEALCNDEVISKR